MLLRARWVVPIAGVPLEHAAVLVRDDRIAAVGPADEIEREAGGEPVRDLGDAALLPGFVNTHSHLELTVMRGLLEMGSFRDWVATLTALKQTRLDDADLMDSARIGALEAVRSGVTCCGDTCDSGFALDALLEAGMRGVVFQEVFGPDPTFAAESLGKLVEKTERLSERAGAGGRVRVGVSPHAPYTVSADLFRRTTRLALDRGLPMAIHAAESEQEVQFMTRGTGPFAERIRARGIRWDPPGESTIAYLARLGVLEARPLLIHAVQASPEDLDAVAESGSALAHCPKSNAKFGHGVAPLGAMLERGIAVGLGTDSVASNNVVDMLDEARTAVLFARAFGRDPFALGAREALALATIGGARALGLDAEIGTLEPGKRADLCAISLEALHVVPVYDVETALVFSASGRDALLTVVGGRVVYDSALETPSRFDDRRLVRRLAEICAKLTAE